MLTIEEIQRFIQEDASSTKKHLASVGNRYYEGDHDIKNYRLYYYNADGVLVEDTNRSNIKISHPFFTEIVDQSAQYMLSGKNGFIKSDMPELQAFLDEYFNENDDFMAELYDTLTGAMSKGFEYMYAYKRSDGKTGFQCADSLGVVEVREQDADDKCAHVIYHYIDRIEKGSKKIERIQVWDADQVYFYVKDGDGTIVLDEDEEMNPRPHIIYTKEGENGVYYDSYGSIPFFRLDNNRKRISDLKPIKELIDDYDLMSCGLSNNLQDASEYLVVVKGFQGDSIDELMQNIKTKKMIGVDGDSAGDGVEFKTVDIPYQAREAKLNLDEKNIYRFGYGLNTAGLKDTAATTNLAIKSAYSLIDMKANKLEIRLKQFIRKMLEPILAEINAENGTDYRKKDVYFDFEREIPTNAQENAQIDLTEAQRRQVEINTILGLASTIDDETILQLICEQLDIDFEEIKKKAPKDEAADVENAQDALDQVETE